MSKAIDLISLRETEISLVRKGKNDVLNILFLRTWTFIIYSPVVKFLSAKICSALIFIAVTLSPSLSKV